MYITSESQRAKALELRKNPEYVDMLRRIAHRFAVLNMTQSTILRN